MAKLRTKLTKRSVMIIAAVLLALAGLAVGLYFLLRKPAAKASVNAYMSVSIDKKGTMTGTRPDGKPFPTRIMRVGGKCSREWDLDKIDYAGIPKEIEKITMPPSSSSNVDPSCWRAQVAGDVLLLAARDVLTSGNVTASALKSAFAKSRPDILTPQIQSLLAKEKMSVRLFVL